MNFLPLIAATLLQAASFIIIKAYQRIKGASSTASFGYTCLTGFVGVLVFFAINGFRVGFNLYSFAVASFINCFSILCELICFKLLSLGTVSMYSMALLSGGMTIPYVFGLAFLNEEFHILKTAGLVLIIGGVILSNLSGEKIQKKQFLMCIAVFFFNGFISVLSKLHQMDFGFETSTDAEFSLYGSLFKSVAAGILYLLTTKNKPQLPTGKASAVPILLATASATVGGISYLLQLYGASILPASVIFPFLTGGSIVATSIAGMLIFREKLTLKSVLSISLCFFGAIMFL